jgi:hypothetical protein
MTENSLTDKILNLDRRIIYVIIIIACAYPFINPIGIPVALDPYTLNFYGVIEDLPEGSDVLWGMGIGPSLTEHIGMSISVIKHLFAKNLNVLFFSVRAETPPIITGILDIAGTEGKVYGEDWVELGFLPGYEPAMAAIAADLWEMATDEYGTPLEDIPLMQDLHTLNDIELTIVTYGSDIEGWVRQWHTAYGTPMLAFDGSFYQGMLPYFPAQIAGLLPGVRGGAEYELLIDQPGVNLIQSDALSLGHMIVILSVIIGNVLYFLSKGQEST